MLISTGHGWSVLGFFCCAFFGSLFFFKDFRGDSAVYRSPWPEVICTAANVFGCLALGLWLNRGRPRRVFEFGLLAPSAHSFCFLRVEYCGLFSALLYGYCLFKGGAFH